MANDGLSPRKQSSEAALAECVVLEAEIAGLRAAYEQYFSGVERVAPLQRHEALKKRLNALKSGFIKQTAVKFRVNGLYAKYLTYERQWAKTLEQRENGTYRPDLERARRRAKQREDQEQRKQGRSAGAGGAERGVVELDASEDVDLDDFDFSEFDAPSAPPPAARAAPPSEDEFDALLDALSEAPTPAAPSAPVVIRSSATSGLPAVRPSSGAAISASGLPAPRPGSGAESPASGLPAVRPGSGAESPASGLPAVRPGSGSASPASGLPAVRPGSGAAIPASARPGTGPMTAVSRAAQAEVQAPRATGGAVSDQKLKAVYDAYVMAKRRCNEDTSQLSFEKVAGELRREVGQLTREGGARSVEFKVVIKDGQAQLRTIPKD